MKTVVVTQDAVVNGALYRFVESINAVDGHLVSVIRIGSHWYAFVEAT